MSSDADLPTATAPFARRQIAGYALVERIAAGGMGEVYLAEDPILQRRVAVKFLLGERSGDTAARERFLREARAMATLVHPNVVAVHAFGDAEGTPYLVMDYIEGETLSERIRSSGPLSVKESLTTTRHVIEALAAAWEKGIVHRDVKPSNVLIDRDGHVRVADFGLAKSVESGMADLTGSTHFVGTAQYVSPEQIRGEKVDFRSDLYSTGIVFYQMLAGRLPFEGHTPAELMAKHLHMRFPSVRKARPDLPAEVAALVESLTEKDAQRRPSTHAEVLQRIDAALAVTAQRRGRSAKIAAAAAAAAIAFLAAWLATRKEPKPVTQAAAIVAEPKPRTIAVLPFRNVSNDQSIDFLSIALADEIGGRLATAPELVVRPTESVLRAKGDDPVATGRELATDHVVTGLYHQSDRQVRLSVNLIETKTGKTLWHDQITAARSEVFTLQEAIVEPLTLALRVRSGRNPREMATNSSAAYYARMQAKNLIWTRMQDPQSLRECERFARSAIRADPNYASAHATLSQCLNVLRDVGADTRPALIDEIVSEASEALRLAPESDEALIHFAAAMSVAGRSEDSLRALAQGVRLRPASEVLHRNLIYAQRDAGLWEEARAEMRIVQRLNSKTPIPTLLNGWFDLWEGKYPQAARAFEELVGGRPNHPFSAYLAQACAGLGNRERATSLLAMKSSMPPVYRARGYAMLGERDAALRLVDAKTKEYAAVDSFAAYDLAAVYALTGNPEAAIEWLRTSRKLGFRPYPAFAGDPVFRSLEGHPRFQQLLAQLRKDRDRAREIVATAGK